MNSVVVVAVVLSVGIVVSDTENPAMEVELKADATKVNDGISKRSAAVCKNNIGNCVCDYYKLKGACIRWPHWVARHCRAACDLCIPGPGDNTECKNELGDTRCESYLNRGFMHIRYRQYMMACHCRKACGLCTVTEAEDETTDEPVVNPAAFREECLRTHNQYRANHNAVALTWDQRSAEYAERVATELNEKNDGKMKHTPVRQRTWGGVTHGENLAYMTGITCQSGTDYWYEERDNYDPSNPVRSFLDGDVGHFTQVSFILEPHIVPS
ncbi:Hypp1971 [Branchiostoma lanceolatum]|uniref:Hypp1971 protein n=1 Tax=Branchiostoma lanceolatum TaxID=7740 RepID=A0A8J9ZQB4_BRALA|nr:Hypp1971 [Branchiostoma lanceolatum]